MTAPVSSILVLLGVHPVHVFDVGLGGCSLQPRGLRNRDIHHGAGRPLAARPAASLAGEWCCSAVAGFSARTHPVILPRTNCVQLSCQSIA